MLIFWGAFYALAFIMAMSISRSFVLDSLLTLMPQKKLQGVNVLAFGIDSTKHSKRSDAMLVVHLDSEKNRVGVLSLPRDTRANIPGKGITKLNHAYAYGGETLLMKSVSEFLNLPIHHYIKINNQGIESLIDSIGGINLNIEKNLYYVDQAGDLYIDLKKGDQTLTGQEAVSYLRFRQDHQGDIGRVKRHQTFLQAVTEKLMSPIDIVKLPLVVKQVGDFIDTDLSVRQMVGLASQFHSASKANRIQKSTLPGAVATIGGVSYWRPDFIAMDRVIDQVLLGFETEQEIVSPAIQTPDESEREAQRRKPTLREVKRVNQQDAMMTIETGQSLTLPKLKIEILNGNGKYGVAQTAATLLKNQGVTVPFFGNAANFEYKETMLVDWKSNVQDTIILAKMLGIKPDNIIVYDKPDKPLDVTIVLGHDWGVNVGKEIQ